MSDRRRQVLQQIVEDLQSDADALGRRGYSPVVVTPAMIGQLMANVQALTKVTLSLLPPESQGKIIDVDYTEEITQ